MYAVHFSVIFTIAKEKSPDWWCVRDLYTICIEYENEVQSAHQLLKNHGLTKKISVLISNYVFMIFYWILSGPINYPQHVRMKQTRCILNKHLILVLTPESLIQKKLSSDYNIWCSAEFIFKCALKDPSCIVTGKYNTYCIEHYICNNFLPDTTYSFIFIKHKVNK